MHKAKEINHRVHFSVCVLLIELFYYLLSLGVTLSVNEKQLSPSFDILSEVGSVCKLRNEYFQTYFYFIKATDNKPLLPCIAIKSPLKKIKSMDTSFHYNPPVYLDF